MTRLGIPGPNTYPYLINEGVPNEAIVYASDIYTAMQVWSLDINGTDPEPTSCRMMADNE